MVACPACGGVNTIQKQCTNTPRTCYTCCTTSGVILTCPWHYSQMGNVNATLRLATGLVHPSIAEAADPDADDTERPAPPSSSSPRRHSDPGAGDGNGSNAPPHAATAAGEQRVDTHINTPPLSLSHAPPPQDASSVTIAAMRAEAAADRSTAQVQHSAIQAQLREQAASTQRLLDGQAAAAKRQFDEMMAALQVLRGDREAALRADVNSTAATTATAATDAAVAATRPNAPPVSSSPPHRSAVLDRSAAIRPSANTFASLDNDESGDSDDEVTPHSHTPLPSAFRPAPAGTAQSAQQQLAAIVNGLSKQSGRVKYSSIAELNEALDDWATSKIAAGWTVQQIESIRAYQRLLVHRLPMSGKSLKVILEYHHKWCKAVDGGAINMFAPKAAFDKDILYDVENPEQFGVAAATYTAKTGKPDKARKPASSAGSEAKPATAKHPVGSCTKHPTSTTHTTAECRLK